MLSIKVQKRAIEFFMNDPSVGARRLMAALRCSRYQADQFLKHARSFRKPSEVKVEKSEPVPETACIPVAAFAEKFDYRKILKDTLEELCADKFISEFEIRKRCGMSASKFAVLACTDEFKRCRIQDGGITWWSIPANVSAVREAARKVGVSK